MNLKNLVPWAARDDGTAAVRFTKDDPIAAMHREMNRVFDDFFRGFDTPLHGGAQLGWPHIELRETDKEFKVCAELPGLEERDVEITFADGVLNLRGEKRREEEAAIHSERWYGAFERQIVLSDDVDPDNVQARFKNGLLTVTLGKKPEAQRIVKRIEIN